MWGQVHQILLTRLLLGIIPTRVGTRNDETVKGYAEEDHPHACGDKTKEIKENSGFAKSTA